MYRNHGLELIFVEVAFVKSVKGRVPGGDWTAAARYLEDTYGAKKKSSIKRWISATKAISDSVLAVIEDWVARYGLNHGLRDGYFYNNDSLVGPEAKVSTRLPETYAVAALQALHQ